MCNILRKTMLFAMVLVASTALSQNKIYHVSPESKGTGDGLSWENATTLANALDQAAAGDQIWVQGFEQITDKFQLYIPDTADGFTLKSGVKLYGGFEGWEVNIADRQTLGKPYQLKYRSVLSGDINGDDVVDNTSLIFPANTTRQDNATHVLTLDMAPSLGVNNNGYPTVVNGFTIIGGHADGSGEYGGGIYITGDNTGGGVYKVERCFFVNNYATQGGAVYVDDGVKNVSNNTSLINQCVVYNNAAGERAGQENSGGGIYLGGEGYVVNSSVFNNENGGLRLSDNGKAVNVTVARNTGGGVDLIANSSAPNVMNSIVWGNSFLSYEYMPTFKNSAFHEVTSTDEDGNIYVTKENRGSENAPLFDAPSLKTGFDRDFDWRKTSYPVWSWNVLEGSVMHDKGDIQYYDKNVLGDADMAGQPRVSGISIDIGAYEFQYISKSRIRYVKSGASGDGSSWDNASGDLQKMIDELATGGTSAGEVWVAAGEYSPKGWLDNSKSYTASFLMRDGISVYGGFAGGENSKEERVKDGNMPWQFKNETILKGASYNDVIEWNDNDNKWVVGSSTSRHVVWFAPYTYNAGAGFSNMTILDGVTIVGGNAQGDSGIEDFRTDCGGGVFMMVNSQLNNCIVKECTSLKNGGGVYMYGGRMTGTLVYNCDAGEDGGGVYVDNTGLILRCMITNNSANNGSGIYLDRNALWDGIEHPEYLIVSTSIVTNNTNRVNGAVYCNDGGVILQSLIAKNSTVRSTDLADIDAAQTGGLYVNKYVAMINSVLWNNELMGSTTAQMYALNPTTDKVRFYNVGVSNFNTSVWNNILQEDMLYLADTNETTGTDGDGYISPNFEADGLPSEAGVDKDLKSVTYFWVPIVGSNLRARGMTLGTMPEEVMVAPELDITGELFQQKPSLGTYRIDATQIVPEIADGGNTLRIYIDADCSVPSHNGSSWATAYRSLNEALTYFASLPSGEQIINGQNVEITENTRLELHVLEGNLWARYAFTNLDPKTATIDISKAVSGAKLYIYGGYRRDAQDMNSVDHDPVLYRSIINGNREGKNIKEGLYHCITVAKGAKVELDGFHVINGYAAEQATRLYGAGLLVHDDADVTLNNCFFENNTAQEGAAIDARNATLTMNNCVVNNNTNTDPTRPVIFAGNLTMNHVTVANNDGAAPAVMGTSSLSVGNTSGTNNLSLASVGADGAKNFANPTNGVGATLGFDTYLGGYSEFRPLTSSTEAGNTIINKSTVTELTVDINGNERNLGGVPDLGAYEAELPKAGKVIYVRSYNTIPLSEESEGSPDFEILSKNPDIIYDGSTWERAIQGNAVCDIDIERGSNNFYVKKGNSLIRATIDMSSYSSQGDDYGPQSNFYGGFFDSNSQNSNSGTKNSIKNNRDERFVSGLQYAIEKAYQANMQLKGGEEPVVVWVGAGIYTDFKGFVIRDGVKVYGGFPADGNPGENDRVPLLSGYVPKSEGNEGRDYDDYETILQIRKETPVTWSGNNPTVANFINSNSNTERHYVLYQPDVCLPTWSPENNNTGWKGANSYRYPGSGSGYIDNTNYVEYSKGALWDGFTVRHGYIKNYTANRDGGAGVRAFRGVTLQNMIVVNNYCHGSRSRGAGLYMDGLNSTIFNSFLLNNMVDGNEAYGGGAYMIVGTGYNMAVANNYSKIAGGGLFIESATFYNNTVVYNKAVGDVKGVGNGSGIFQYADGNARISKLLLYNCIFYGNSRGTTGTNYQITSNTPGTFDYAHNCYVSGSIYSGLNNKFPENYGNQLGANLPNPFEAGNNAQAENNYRLSSTSSCVNSGTDVIEGIILPETDMDYTSRIKDCTIDIGAYERSNQDNVKSDVNGIYYVTQNGSGNACGDSPANAACSMKLQEVLNVAGERAHDGYVAIVKIAGYNQASNAFVYHVNTLSNPDDPQSYTFVVPEGVTVEGGYSEDFAKRDPYTLKTRLSALKNATATMQEVNGYHTITFKSYNETTVTGVTTLNKNTIIDGLYIEDGSATSMAGTGNPNTMGGGAIVPSGAHVRNCVVMNCEAIQGGGLYLMPGALVSGTVIKNNYAEEGGGIFADNTDAGADLRSHVVSCTVTDNEAQDVGGGIFQKEGGLMAVNSVIWGNAAPADRNVSGVVTVKFEDNALRDMVRTIDEAQVDNNYYPYNYCFVETFEMPTTFENTSMSGDGDIYFEDESRRLKVYSPMIKRGMLKEYALYWENNHHVAQSDILNIARIQTDYTRADAGAFAYLGGSLPTNTLIKRIFVSKGTNLQLSSSAKMEDYLGRSFYTSLNHLDDALEYINRVRNAGTGGANDDTVFEVLLGPGIYKPSIRRTGAASTILDQRQNSFVIPKNVKIYGGFSGDEAYSTGIDVIPAESGDKVMKKDGELPEMLSNREFSDMNGNKVYEPWELAHQAILSGGLDVSSAAKNVYHVVYSNGNGDVTLDGVTVMSGETSNVLSDLSKTNELGRGGGIYSNGMNYTLHRCRIISNKAVRGGGIYVRSANVNLIGSLVAGNGPVAGYAGTDEMRGGGIYASEYTGDNINGASVRAVNSLFANNETDGAGGAVAVGGVSTVDLVNCNIVRNKANRYGALYDASIPSPSDKNKITNTIVWGNEDGAENQAVVNDKYASITYSASEWLATDFDVHNICLNKDNMAIDGPRFKSPSSVAGVAGNSYSSMWNPASVSVLADVGNGTKNSSGETGVYKEWFDSYAPSFEGQYMKDAERYMAPMDENGIVPDDKVIDIGLFEYQHWTDMSTLDAVYVATVDAGDASGKNWANATSDLRQAIIALSNPTGNQGSTEKKIYVRDGEYSMAQLSHNNVAFPLYMNESTDYGTSLDIFGSCTGNEHEQDFSRPTMLTSSDLSKEPTNILLDISTNNKPVSVSGFAFVNTADGSDKYGNGCGVNIMDIGTSGQVVLKNVRFQNNYGYGVRMVENSGKMLIVNALFADGAFVDGSAGIGLHPVGNVTVVNSTFAQNRIDIDNVNGLSVFNSASWENQVQNLPEDGNNVKFDSGIENENVKEGPNFVDPNNTDVLSRDYSIRPSLKLFNKGNAKLYNKHVLNDELLPTIPTTERDLANNVRQSDTEVDVGAYEYNGTLEPIIYVKPVIGGDGSGSSWTNATGDLQGAVDLASVYSDNNGGKNGYVFVHNNYSMTEPLRVSMPGAVIYGGMNDELSSKTTVDEIVSDLLGKRQGVLQSNKRTLLGQGISILDNSLVDGFEIDGSAQISNNGCLSTSIVNGSVTGDASATGLLYNSLVLGDVSDVKAVNVTASGSMDDAGAGSGNNRSSVEDDNTNTHVTDNYWNYQLMETSEDIDPDQSENRIEDISDYMEKVGHERDLIGNKRIRYIVDNGCFETWNICERMTTDNVITSTDYPIGKSVVYVRKEQELKIQNADDGTLVYKDESSAFNPGFLLLEHHAGLRGCGNYIRLTNFAAEYDVRKDSAELVAMPFDINSVTSVLGGIIPKRYDGSRRATYDYKYDNDGGAWTDLVNIDEAEICEGLLFENDAEEATDKTLRFYGKSNAPYIESGVDKAISLNKYNFNEAWTTDADGNIVPSTSNRFTHKENMSWNLFGSPYLCAMNYSDLEYGRVLYGYDNYNGYRSVKTYGDDGTTEGYIPRGSAVFTQSATLKDNEIFRVKLPDGSRNGSAFGIKARLSIVLHEAGATRGVAGVRADVLQLETVEPENARTDFDINADGVKWFACVDSMPLIYAEQGSGRYSLLSAVSSEGVLALGVTLYDAGAYVIALDENSDVSDYDAVTLTDKVAGKTVNLKDGGYEFTAVEGGDVTDRFTLRFTSIGEGDDEGIRIVASGDGKAEVYGVDAGDVVCIYDTAGRLVARRMCSGDGEKFTLKKGVFVFQADRNERGRSTKKYMVK